MTKYYIILLILTGSPGFDVGCGDVQFNCRQYRGRVELVSPFTYYYQH